MKEVRGGQAQANGLDLLAGPADAQGCTQAACVFHSMAKLGGLLLLRQAGMRVCKGLGHLQQTSCVLGACCYCCVLGPAAQTAQQVIQVPPAGRTSSNTSTVGVRILVHRFRDFEL